MVFVFDPHLESDCCRFCDAPLSYSHLALNWLSTLFFWQNLGTDMESPFFFVFFTNNTGCLSHVLQWVKQDSEPAWTHRAMQQYLKYHSTRCLHGSGGCSLTVLALALFGRTLDWLYLRNLQTCNKRWLRALCSVVFLSFRYTVQAPVRGSPNMILS